ncbi:hypothetical protein J4455_00050 [Candidatus Woesearchaeota archaeon]|nr:hypothetical protein [Candidatus Woesearchaeota archaeon]
MKIYYSRVYEGWERSRRASKLGLILSSSLATILLISSGVNQLQYESEKSKAIASYYAPVDTLNHDQLASQYLNNSNLLLRMTIGSIAVSFCIYGYMKWSEKQRDNWD